MDQRNLPIYGVIAVSVIVLLLFVLCLGVAFFLKDQTSLQLLIGAVVSMSSGVVGYWVGSSVGSAKKDETIAAAVKPAP